MNVLNLVFIFVRVACRDTSPVEKQAVIHASPEHFLPNDFDDACSRFVYDYIC